MIVNGETFKNYESEREKMELSKISQEVRMHEWAAIIKEARESGLSIRQWCKLNNITEQKYYYWLKRIRKNITEQVPFEETHLESQTTFIPIEVNQPTAPIVNTSKIIIIKDDIHIELPDTISEELLINIARSLLC